MDPLGIGKGIQSGIQQGQQAVDAVVDHALGDATDAVDKERAAVMQDAITLLNTATQRFMDCVDRIEKLVTSMEFYSGFRTKPIGPQPPTNEPPQS